MKTCSLNDYVGSRYDYFLIWQHGLVYLDQILSLISENDNFDIILVKRVDDVNLKELVNQVYSNDYAPIDHLQNKLKYLFQLNGNSVYFVFVKNYIPKIKLIGEGRFEHIECLKIKELKNNIRNEFNPKIDGELTHNHIIHASDNELQTDSILKYLGYLDGISAFDKQDFLNSIIPYYLPKVTKYQIVKVSFDILYCRLNFLDANNCIFTEIHHISKSPHYLSLKSDNYSFYEIYLINFMGRSETNYRSVTKFKKLADSYFNGDNKILTDFVICKKVNDSKYLILDGLHRASIFLKRGLKSIPILITNE